MSFDVDAIVARVRLEAGIKGTEAPAADGRARLERFASEFESMLLVQMLRDMRRAGRWGEDEGEEDGFGATPLFEMFDVELATQMARAQGLGLTSQLLDAYDRAAERPGAAGAAPLPPAAPAASTVSGIRLPSAAPAATGAAEPVVTSPFGWRRDPLTGETRFHRGVDLRAAYGQDVSATSEGRVAFSGPQGGYGTTVVVEHADGSRTRYAHLSAALVVAGEPVSAGQTVGRAGASGRATGPHLHVERLDRVGRPVDPLTPSHGLLKLPARDADRGNG